MLPRSCRTYLVFSLSPSLALLLFLFHSYTKAKAGRRMIIHAQVRIQMNLLFVRRVCYVRVISRMNLIFMVYKLQE